MRLALVSILVAALGALTAPSAAAGAPPGQCVPSMPPDTSDPHIAAVASVPLQDRASLYLVVPVGSTEREGYTDLVVGVCAKKMRRTTQAQIATAMAAALTAQDATSRVEKMRVTWWKPGPTEPRRGRVLGTDTFPSYLWSSEIAQSSRWQRTVWTVPGS